MTRAACLFGLLLLAGCAYGGPRCACSPGELDGRLQTTLWQQLANGQAGLQQTPDGTQVTLADSALFAPDGETLDDHGRLIVARVIEGIFDPRIMRIEVTHAPLQRYGLQAARSRSVADYFNEFRVGPAKVAGQPAPTQVMMASVAPAPQGVAITLRVVPD